MSRYIDTFGIKSSVYLQNHLRILLKIDIICSKEGRGVNVIWCHNNHLHNWIIEASVIYVIQENQIQELVDKICISKSLPSISVSDYFDKVLKRTI